MRSNVELHFRSSVGEDKGRMRQVTRAVKDLGQRSEVNVQLLLTGASDNVRDVKQFLSRSRPALRKEHATTKGVSS